MHPEKIVCDHDGTFTDAEREFDTYRDVYLHGLSKKLGSIPLTELDQYFNDAACIIESNPQEFTWKIDGTIIAPGTADHVLFVRTCAEITLENLTKNGKMNMLPHRETWSSLLSELYWESYPRAGTSYKDGAKNILIDLHSTGRFTFITNSDTTAVRQKLNLLLKGSGIDPSALSVIGNAKKWSIDLSWNECEATMQPEHFPHAIQLRRKEYANALRSLHTSIGVVAGDIFEMDLAMPSSLGIYTILLTSRFTTPWEYNHYEKFPNGKRAATLFELRDLLDPVVR